MNRFIEIRSHGNRRFDEHPRQPWSTELSLNIKIHNILEGQRGSIETKVMESAIQHRIRSLSVVVPGHPRLVYAPVSNILDSKEAAIGDDVG
jgi:hypothetical protein